MKHDLEAAARVQQTLLPDHLPEVQGFSFAWKYKPCDELGGDALNLVRINEDLLALYLLDVSGHGVPAALLSVTACRSLQLRAGGAASLVAGPGANPEAVEPAQVVSKLNALYPIASNAYHYFTMVYGLLDVHTRRLRFTVAGHPGPVLAPAGGQPRRLNVPGFPVGLVEGAEFDESVIELQPGDRLYLHSDGVNEEMNAQDEQFGDERLFAALAEGQALSLNDSVDLLIRKVIDWRGEDHLKDDVSILAIAIA
jgi:sigma-B regulation protein RsbU (phosphoserine phosphatase)